MNVGDYGQTMRSMYSGANERHSSREQKQAAIYGAGAAYNAARERGANQEELAQLFAAWDKACKTQFGGN